MGHDFGIPHRKLCGVTYPPKLWSADLNVLKLAPFCGVAILATPQNCIFQRIVQQSSQNESFWDRLILWGGRKADPTKTADRSPKVSVAGPFCGVAQKGDPAKPSQFTSVTSPFNTSTENQTNALFRPYSALFKTKVDPVHI